MTIQLLSPIPESSKLLTKTDYYVIENFPFPCFIHDENGIPISFPNFSEAAEEATQCHNGFVITFNATK